MESDLLNVKSNNRSLRHQLDDAEKKITELENRPVEIAVQEDEEGKMQPVKMGLAPIQREDTEYEFDIVLDIARNHKSYFMRYGVKIPTSRQRTIKKSADFRISR